MFTGIVGGTSSVVSIKRCEGLHTLEIALAPEALSVLVVGSSVAIDGVCLTVTELLPSVARFDVMRETLRVTTLGELCEGSVVNTELSLSTQRDISGHIVSGHVDATATIIAVERPDERNCTVVFSVDRRWMSYIFPKGYIAVHGCSLTVGSIDRLKGEFRVYLIPETMRRTTFGNAKVGGRVNIEVERQTQVLVDTIRACFEEAIRGGFPFSPSGETP
jgi:riboflavin synthase